MTIKIIDGKRYDTETAERICFAGNNHDRSDFRCLDVALYRTPKGAWFIEGFGGASSRFAHNTGNGFCGSEDLQVIEWADAREIMEREGCTPDLEKYFVIRVG